MPLVFPNTNGLSHNPCSKTGLVTTSWERLYFFTQGGNLMCQPRGAVAGGLIQDLDNCSVMAVDCEDRRYCFQITTPNGKSYVTWVLRGWRTSVVTPPLPRASWLIPPWERLSGQCGLWEGGFVFFRHMTHMGPNLPYTRSAGEDLSVLR